MEDKAGLATGIKAGPSGMSFPVLPLAVGLFVAASVITAATVGISVVSFLTGASEECRPGLFLLPLRFSMLDLLFLLSSLLARCHGETLERTESDMERTGRL
jgi:hypothetical protein